RECVSKPMNARCPSARRYLQRQSRQQVVAEGVTDGVSRDPGAAVPGEERCLRDGQSQALLAQRGVRAQALGVSWTEGSEPPLAELAVTYEQHLALQVDVTPLQSRDLADA